ncbi:lipopolysaccharide synthesis sugar transferase [Fructobacillus pseudoficulneus]|uniref:Lipopolysaccharide synthesis sugar transferase n=1 Tax=Fructobacillus pseudoficulneus TaxID=220714 RepID=A0A3F3GVK0_9LACO|nr:sugar transferase [Fructobacillus pseudoficulneus]GAP02342.1 lipopolysaccharide synthesis sugar transferase [Fructobacillus pseudoficulneus]SEH36419.1 Sugar transferase involved in LPS biosynthesis (colanic, teichoic acid) [Fructobacillus pseudoficulneus]
MKQFLFYRLPKRILDIVVSLCALVILSPVFLVIMIIIKCNKGTSHVFYTQDRVGQGGKHFKIYKFQSMIDNADQILRSNDALYQKFIDNGYKLPTKEDPRITKIGAVLRKTSLDELPQFWNTLIGNMSIIGPRPVVESELVEYGDQKRIDKFLSVKPGVFGLWQASGRSNIGYPERAEIELDYVDRANLGLDFKIMFLTVVAIFKGDGAF